MSGLQSEGAAFVAAAGDVDGDGFGDLAVTVIDTTGPDRAFWLRGSVSGLNTHETFIQSSNTATLLTVAGLGDFNGDQFADLIVPYVDFNTEALRIYAGSPQGYSAAPVLIVEPAGGEVGDYSLSAAGDVNGDGLGDFIVGEPGFYDGRLLGRPTS